MADYRKRIDPPTQYKNMFGDRSKKPLSVQMTEAGLEVATPLGTVNDIQAELQKKNPNYALIAGMAGLELLGPAASAVQMAAKAGNKGLLQKILDAFKKDPEAGYDPVITGSGAGPRVTEFSEYDYTNDPRLKGSPEDLGFTEDAYHYTRSEKIDKDKFDPDLAISNWNRLGIHVGTKKAARDRFTGTNDPEFPEEAKGTTLPLKVRTNKPLMFSDEVESELSLRNKLVELAESRGLDPLDWAEDLRKQLAEEGYTHIPYINEVEDEGSISYIMLTDRPKNSDAVLRSRFAKFDPSKKDKPELGMDEGGLAKSKGLSWGELIVDNILGLDNEYESFGEKLGKAINEDEIKFLKNAAVGVYEGTKEFVQAPVETTKQVISEIKDSVTRLGSEDLNTRLQRMYGVSYDQATDEQVNQAREAVLGDALTALELVPAAKAATTIAGAAIPSGFKADVMGQTKAMLSGDREFLSGTPTPKADAQPAGAQVSGMFTPRQEPKPEVAPADPTNTKTFDGLYGLSVEEGVPELGNQDASFYSNLISDQERWQIGEDFAQLTFENNANYGDEYNVMHNITGNAYTTYVDDLADQVKQEVGRIFKERLQLIDAEQLLRLAALQRMHKQNGLQEGSNSAAEVMDLAEGIRQTLNLTDNVRVYGPETYLGNQPFDAKVRTLDENGAIVDKKVSDLKGEDGKYLLKDLVGLGSSNRLNERFESIILDIVDSDNFLTPNSEIYAGSTTPQTFKSYIDHVINTEDSFFNQTPYKGADQTFRNINVEVLDEFLKKTSNKPVPLTGSRILSILQNDPRVNSKNIPKAIFEAEKDKVFDPSQAKELLELYSFQVKPKSQDNYSRFQRQVDEGLAIGTPKGYNELTLNVDPDNAVPAIQPKRRHFDQDTLVHTRYTVMEPDAPNLSDETRELLGNEDFILVEELQSDLLSGGYETYKKLDFESLVNNTMRGTTGPDARIYEQVLKNKAGVLLSRYFEDFEKFAIQKFDDKYNKGIDVNSRDYIKKGDQLIDSLTDKHEEWLKTSYPNATEEQFNTALVNFRSNARNFLYDMADDEGKLHDAVLRMGSKTRKQAEINVEALEDPFLFGTPPIKKNIEGVELNLQNLISRASQLGINKIVIPPFEKIASARFYGEDLDLALKNQVMDRDGNIKTGHRLYQTYVTDLEKALKKFEQSYPIKVNRDVDIPYQGQKSLSTFPDIKYPDGLDITMLKGIVIDISDMSKEFDLENPRFAEGGTVDMNQQMSFAFADGGLRDDGMREDPVSGNEVPAGSMAKEVRDDIPAQLSEGEYVVPADVVRYYGVKFFEDLRDAAKMGLQDMEARGRIGGEPVPAGGPMNEDDLTPEEMAAIQEMMGMSEGGTVAGFAPGGLQTDQDFLAAGQQAQQRQFTGFPLGATIFPRAESGEIEAVPTPAATITVQETAESCARKGMSYDPATQTCVAMPVQAPVQTGGSSNDGPPPPPPESKPWYEGVDWTTTDIAEPTAVESIIQQIPGVGQIVSMRNIAGQYAKANILEAAGDIKAANQIRDNIEEYIGKQSLGTKIAQDAFGRYADGDWMTVEYLNSIGIETPKGLKTEDGGGMPEFIKELANDPTKRALIAGSIDPERKELINQSAAREEAKRIAAEEAAREAQRQANVAASIYASQVNKPASGDNDSSPIVTTKSIKQTKDILSKAPDKAGTAKNLSRTTAKIKDITSGKNTSGQVGFKSGGLMKKKK